MAVVLGLLLCGCAGLSEPAPGEAQSMDASASGLIRGVVVDESFRPIADAEVAVFGSEFPTAHTGVEGDFEFEPLPTATHVLVIKKAGFLPVQQYAKTDQGSDLEPLVVQMVRVPPSSMGYYSVQKFEGYIECTTGYVAVCGGPNVLSMAVCQGFGLCLGNVTNDQYGAEFHYWPYSTMIQSEMHWESAQALTSELTLIMETLSGCLDSEGPVPDSGYEEIVEGASAIFNVVDIDEITRWGIGQRCSILHSVFSGGLAGTNAGVTLQQRFTIVSHAFYGYTPPEGWQFSLHGDPPIPSS
jgi:hypothetical protein